MNKKILVTGAAGFIGSHLTEFLVKKGYDVVAFDRYNPNNNWGWLEGSEILDQVNVVLGDIRDYDSVSKAMKGCAYVFHLSALIGIPYSYISPLAYIRTNVEGTYNVLESAKNLNLDQILITSTSETYGTAQKIPINETHPLVGQSPYSASKIAADQLTISYSKSFGLPIKIVRPFNTYGPRQSARAIIPTISSQLLSGSNEIILGNLKPTRDLTYVSDTCKGFLSIFKSGSLFGHATNIGMNSEISMADLAKLIGKLLNTDVKISISNKRKRPLGSEVDRLLCDNSKLIKNTSWSPDYNLENGLREFLNWMRNPEVLKFYKPDLYNV